MFTRCLLLQTSYLLRTGALDALLAASSRSSSSSTTTTISTTTGATHGTTLQLYTSPSSLSLRDWSSRYYYLSLTLGLASQLGLAAALARFQQVAGDSANGRGSSSSLTGGGDSGLSLSAMRGLLKARAVLQQLARRIREKIMEILRAIRYRLMSEEARAFEDHRAWPPAHRLAAARAMPVGAVIRYARHHSQLVRWCACVRACVRGCGGACANACANACGPTSEGSMTTVSDRSG